MRLSLIVVLLACLVAAPARANDPRLAEAQRLSEESARLESAGQYEQAAEVFARAIDEFKRVAGADHPNVASFELKLGTLYLTASRYDRAEPLLLGVLATMEKRNGPTSTTLLGSLSTLATLYVSMGSFERARPLYQRALTIAKGAEPRGFNVATLTALLGALETFETHWDAAVPLLKEALAMYQALLGPEHGDLVKPMAALATAYDALGDAAHAEPLFVRALALMEKARSPSHPETALMRNNLASFYVEDGAYEKAEPLARRALADTETALGRSHPQTASLTSTLVFILMARGDAKNEVVPLLLRSTDGAEELLRNARLTSTEARMTQFLQMYAAQEQLAYSVAAARPRDAAAARLGLAAALLRKGRTVDEAADLSKVVQASLLPDERSRFAALRGLRGELAARALSPEQDRKRVAELEQKAEALEQELVLRSLPLRAQATRPPARAIVERVAATLPADGALVEIVAHDAYLFGTRRKQEHSRPTRYAAFVLASSGPVRWIDLGPAAAIDAAVTQLLAADRQPSPTIDLGPAQALERLVMRPLLPLLDGKKSLYLSPDGQLNLVPFAALHDGERYLIDRFALTLLGSGRDLLGERTPHPGVLVLADPRFGSVGAPAPRRALLPAKVPPLPGTRQEAAALRKLMPSARVILGAAATREALLAADAPGVLHVATHGVFLADLTAAERGTRGLQLTKAGEPDVPLHPLLRSALVLAGDGLATALEIAGMNLWGTQLVVLSACDTARGDVRLGQGVFGLRRALVVAGAETVVSSLWRVDDAATRDLMTRFYAALLAGRGRSEALQEAALAVRATRPHPYYWAPFVVIGRAGPLVGIK
jgi:CHAT domain-containing protein/tetratricopeptide (TPR) repeat protein